ncbi:MAG: hypothetical protein WC707_05260 [Candidatus Babeliaceae bacterium]|jgi:CRISPR/Cas system CSM-associated protein Csm5 (group 7 of RAMP superfamily)
MKNIKKIHAAFLIAALTLCQSSNSMQHLENITKNLNRGLDFGWTAVKYGTIIGTFFAVKKYGYDYFWKPNTAPTIPVTLVPAVQNAVQNEVRELKPVFENIITEQKAQTENTKQQFQSIHQEQVKFKKQQNTGYENLMSALTQFAECSKKAHEKTQKQIAEHAEQSKIGHETTHLKIEELSKNIGEIKHTLVEIKKGLGITAPQTNTP